MKTAVKSKTLRSENRTEVAIIGVSLRFPKSDSLDEFWDHLMAKESLVTEVPSNRWEKEKFFGDPRNEANKTNSIWGGFIDDPDCFDASFFNISPREAMFMDPQQRITLELAWKAIEDAGYKAGSLKASQTGVYMGACNTDYTELMESQVEEVDAYIPTGTSYAILANRISFWFDLKGPSITIDTACAGSLVAIYQAVRALQNGDCEYALAGGVNLCWTPRRFIALSRSGMLSKGGKCKPFDEQADGYVRGEGGAILLLKPLKKAVADRDHIYAVIKGVGTNHGGRTNSLTITNPKAQADLITDIYRKAGVSPETVSYIETHGPGTALGDPIEIHGLKTAFTQLYKDFHKKLSQASCGLGSVKTNIGHLESAAGIAGVLKIFAAMQHQTLPANINFNRLNPLINLDDSAFYIIDETKAWEGKVQDDGSSLPRRAGVSSFGFGGSNAHLVLEEYIPQVLNETPNTAEIMDNPVLLPLSAKNSDRLRDYTQKLLQFLKKTSLGNPDLPNIAYTLQLGREAMEERIIFLVEDITEFTAKLEAYLGGETEINECWQGQLKQEINSLNPDETMAAEIETCINEGRLDKIAGLWTQGYEVDWERFYVNDKPHRISLPTYVFAKERYWLPEAKTNQFRLELPLSIHPLLQQNTSTLSEQRYSSNFTGEEFFLADHIVRGQKILPEAAYLEMARVAVEMAAGGLAENKNIKLRNIIWDHSTFINGQVHIGVYPEVNGELIYGIYSETEDASCVHDIIVYCEGSAILNPVTETPVFDLKAIQSCCNKSILPGSRCYEEFKRMALEYGPGYQGIDSIYVGEEEALAKLKIPPAVSASLNQFVLHPSIIKAALQASLGLILKDTGMDGKYPPISSFIAEIEILDKCDAEMWAWIRNHEGYKIKDTTKVFDIDICNAQGKLSVRIKGLVYQEGIRSANALSFMKGAAVLKSEVPIIPDKPRGIVLRSLSDKILLPTGPVFQSGKAITVPTPNKTEQSTKTSNEIAAAHVSAISAEALQKELATGLAEVLYIKQGDVDIDKKFVDLGLDSIIGVEWIRKVNKRYGTSIAATKVYDYPCIREFARFLAQELNKQKGASSVKPILEKPTNLNILENNIPSGKPRRIQLCSLSNLHIPLTKAATHTETIVITASHAKLPEEFKSSDIKVIATVSQGISAETLQRELAVSLAEVLYIKQNDIDIDKKFVDLGLDSIIGVEWIRMINKQYGTAIAATKVYDYPNIRELSGFLARELTKQINKALSSSCKPVPGFSLDDVLIQVYHGTIEVEPADRLLHQIFKENEYDFCRN